MQSPPFGHKPGRRFSSHSGLTLPRNERSAGSSACGGRAGDVKNHPSRKTSRSWMTALNIIANYVAPPAVKIARLSSFRTFSHDAI